MSQEKANRFLIPISIIAAGCVIGGAIIFSRYLGEKNSSLTASPLVKEGVSGTGESVNSPQASPMADGEDDPYLGNPNAPITMVVFLDFLCSFCKKLHTEIIPQVEEKYVKSGQVKIVFRDFAFLGIASNLAAEGAACAQEQGKYFEYADLLYEAQEGHDPAAFSKENLKKMANGLELDSTEFNQCLDSGKYKDEMAKDLEAGRAAGVKGTPASFVNGQPVNGAQPFEVFEEVIKEELAKVQK